MTIIRPNVVFTKSIDKKEMMKYAQSKLQEGYDSTMDNIERVITSLSNENGYFGHFRAEQMDWETLREQIDRYRFTRLNALNAGIGLEDYDAYLNTLLCKLSLNHTPIGSQKYYDNTLFVKNDEDW